MARGTTKPLRTAYRSIRGGRRSIARRFLDAELEIFVGNEKLPLRVIWRRLAPSLAICAIGAATLIGGVAAWENQVWNALQLFLMLVFAVAFAGSFLALAVIGNGTHQAWMRGFNEARSWSRNEHADIGGDVSKIARMDEALAVSLAYLGFVSAVGLTGATVGIVVPYEFDTITIAISAWAFVALTLTGTTTLHRLMMWTQAGTIRMRTGNFGPYDPITGETTDDDAEVSDHEHELSHDDN